MRRWVWRRRLSAGGWRSAPPGDWTSNHEGPGIEIKGKWEECIGKSTQGREHCHTMLNYFWLMNFYSEQVLGISTMARPTKSRGHGKWAQVPRNEKDPSTYEPCKGRKLVEKLISEATEAYRECTDEGI